MGSIRNNMKHRDTSTFTFIYGFMTKEVCDIGEKLICMLSYRFFQNFL